MPENKETIFSTTNLMVVSLAIGVALMIIETAADGKLMVPSTFNKMMKAKKLKT